MVTGIAPFQGRLVGDTLSNARAGRYVEPEGLSDAANDFLARMLELVRIVLYFWVLLVEVRRGLSVGFPVCTCVCVCVST